MPKKKSPPTPKEERERFIAAAREHGCDESPEAFEAALKRLAAATPTTNAEVKRKAAKHKKRRPNQTE